MPEDRPLELTQLRARLEAELLRKHTSRLAVDLERLRLTSSPVEREDQLRTEVLSQRVLGQQPLQLRDQLRAPSRLEIGVDAALDRAHVELVETCDLSLEPDLVGDVRERRASPEIEGVCKVLRPLLRRQRVRIAYELLEAAKIDRVCGDTKCVTPFPAHEHVRTERLAEARDVVLERGGGVGRRVLAPQLVDQAVGSHHLVRAEDQECEQGTPLRAGDVDLHAAVGDLERAEDAELHLAPTVTPGCAARKLLTAR